jgi:hypothetical protein
MSLIGTRTVATIFFDDQVSLLKVHAWLGKYGTLFIFFAPTAYYDWVWRVVAL